MPRVEVLKARFWKTYWFALRRSHRDASSRRAFMVTTMTLLFLLAYGGLYGLGLLRVFQDKEGRGFMLAHAAATILGALIILWFISRKDDPPSLRIAAQRESDLATDPHLRRRLATDAFTLAILLARNSSEHFLRHQQLPDNVEIVTRRHHLNQLRSLALWDSLPLPTRDLLLAPDGHWSPDAIDEWHSFEALRCLRWVLRLDEDLTPIAHLPRLSGKLIQALIGDAGTLLQSKGMQDIWDIRLERIAADQFFGCCFAELVGRGLVPQSLNEDSQSWVKHVYQRARDPEHRDLLVAHNTVAELEDGTLRYIASIAWHRDHTLQHVMDLIDQSGNQARWQAWTSYCFPERSTAREQSPHEPLTAPGVS